MSLKLFAGGITASLESRTLAGPVVAYGVHGRTSKGRLKVRPGALYVVGDVSGVKLTKEHLLDQSRGHAAAIEFLPDGIRAAMKVSEGPEGDAALQEAQDKTRDGFSFHILDEQIVGDEIVSGRLIAIGQVGIPAYDHMRMDSIAAALHINEGDTAMTDEQRARLAELLANDNRTPEEETEFAQLVALAVNEAAGGTTASTDDDKAAADKAAADKAVEDKAAADKAAAEKPATEDKPVGVAAGLVPAIPGGIPTPKGGAARTKPQGASAFDTMISGLVQAFKAKRSGGNPMPGITAALTDVTSTANTDNIEPVGWSGELFSGVDYQPLFSDLLESGPLENWNGKGWRFTSTPAMQDYAGDKAPIPSGTVATEESLWEAARGAVGLDIDRKYFDFPNGEFLSALFREMAGSWVELVDGKCRAFEIAEAVHVTRPITVGITSADATITFAAGVITAADVGKKIVGTGIPAAATILSYTDATHAELSANATATNAALSATIEVVAPSLLKAAARVGMSLNRRYGSVKAPSSTGADWILMNDEDHYHLLDLVEDKLPAYLELFKIDPANFRPSPDMPAGYVYGGVKKAGKLRTEKQPIVVDALNLANGGIDKAFYGYWAIEEQHPRGIQKAAFSAVVEA